MDNILTNNIKNFLKLKTDESNDSKTDSKIKFLNPSLSKKPIKKFPRKQNTMTLK